MSTFSLVSCLADAYRHAVDLNPRDYRAWYGLGQTYELMLMPYYALYYYRRATMLRPSDARMWCALGQCYESEQLDLHAAAIRCYRRAVANGDREGIALHKLVSRCVSWRGAEQQQTSSSCTPCLLYVISTSTRLKLLEQHHMVGTLDPHCGLLGLYQNQLLHVRCIFFLSS